MKRLFVFAPLIMLALIAAAAIAMLARPEARAPHFEARVGRAAPVYELARLGGGAPVTPQDFSGRAYVINVFASWCAPCRIEAPMLMELQRQGAPILGVAYKDTPEAAAQMLRELGDPYEAKALDPDGAFGLDLGVTAAPETFVIDANGRIAGAYRGALTEEVLRREILPALRD